MENIGVYIHIPFCESKCGYCDFNSFAGRSHFYEQYKNALVAEIKATPVIGNFNISSIFFGGGTPSVLPPEFIGEMMATFSQFHILDTAEITIEANPNSLTKEKLRAYTEFGINRLSIGLQAWQDRLLERLGRVHRLQDFTRCYENARNIGFSNINVDLMFAIPEQTTVDWQETLENICGLSPEHISTYSLILEEGTPFYSQYEQGQLTLCDEQLDRQMYELAKDTLEKNNYIHYEISNFAKTDFLSKHNVLYWERNNYLGFGLSAHSLLDNTRYANCDDLEYYIRNSRDLKKIRVETNVITQVEAMEEFMFLGLRLLNGINTQKFYAEFGNNIACIYGKVIDKNINTGLLKLENNRLFLTNKGIDLANMVMADFMI